MSDGLFRRFFIENTIVKIMALVFAVVLWYFVVGEKKSEVGFLIPLELKNLPKNMVIIGEPVREIEVRVIGSKKVLANLSPSQFSVSLDLSSAQSGYNNIRITRHDIKAPESVEIIKITPSPVVIHLDTILRKTIPVKVKLSGAPAPGFMLKDVSVRPESVTVTGIESLLKELSEISTVPVDIQGIKGERIKAVLLQIPDAGIKKVEPEAVRVRISVTTFKKGKK